MLTDILFCICFLNMYQNIYYLSHLRLNKETELNELESSKTPSQMSSYAHKHVFLYLHAQTNINTLFFEPTQNHKKSKKIQFTIFINKSSKNHNAKNICRRAFCLAPNGRELLNLFK